MTGSKRKSRVTCYPSAPVSIQSAAVLEAVKAAAWKRRSSVQAATTAGLDSTLRASAQDICGRDGRKPAGAVEQKKAALGGLEKRGAGKEVAVWKGLDKVPLI